MPIRCLRLICHTSNLCPARGCLQQLATLLRCLSHTAPSGVRHCQQKIIRIVYGYILATEFLYQPAVCTCNAVTGGLAMADLGILADPTAELQCCIFITYTLSKTAWTSYLQYLFDISARLVHCPGVFNDTIECLTTDRWTSPFGAIMQWGVL